MRICTYTRHIVLMAAMFGLPLMADTINNSNWPTFPQFSGGHSIYEFDVAIGLHEEIKAGDFFRIYDFGGLTGTPTAPAGWTVTVANTNTVPPPSVILTYGDDPALPNITFTYEGATPIVGATDITGFEAFSTDPLSNHAFKDAVGLSTNDAGGALSSVNAVLVPGAPAPVPEPSSVALLAAAAVFTGRKLFRRERT